MKKINYNNNWTYYHYNETSVIEKNSDEDVIVHSKGALITLPHDAMIHRKRIPGLKNGSYTGFYPSGDYRYEKKSMANKNI